MEFFVPVALTTERQKYSEGKRADPKVMIALSFNNRTINRFKAIIFILIMNVTGC
jgi:hypothetical protein